MEAAEVQLHTFISSKPDTVERSTTHTMEVIEVQQNTFLLSGTDTVERSTAHRMEAVYVQLHTFLNSNQIMWSGQLHKVWRQYKYSSTHS